MTGTVTLHEPVFHTNEKLITDGVIINESPDEISATVVFEVVRASDGEMFGRNVSSDVFPPRMSVPFSNSLSTSAWTPGEYEVRLWIGKNDPTVRRLLDLKTFTLMAPE